MPQIQRVRLPEHFYLPRETPSGRSVRDQIPWKDAASYVSDGTRYGVEMKDGEVTWFEADPVERFARDFAGAEIDLDEFIRGLRQYIVYRQDLRDTWSRLDEWQRDLAALEEVSARRAESPQ